MRWRIRNQLLALLLVLVLGVVTLSVWMALSSANHARQQIETRVRNVARNLSEASTYPLSLNVLLQMKRLSGADYLLISKEGERLTTLDVLPKEPPFEVVETDWQKLQLGSPVELNDARYLCSGIRFVRPPRAGSILYILYPESLLRDARWDAMRPVLIVGGTVSFASLLLAMSLGQRLSRRLQDLERRTRLIASGDFSPMPIPPQNDEIRDLTISVNEMASQLAQLHETTRRSERLRLLGQVSGGLAHQLRNGTTGARLAVQLFLQQCPPSVDVEPLRKALGQLTLQETHLQRFLHLGRQTQGERTPCDLADLLRQTLDLLSSQCRHENIELSGLTSDAPCPVLGDAGQLGQLFVNIVSNAIEAAGPNGAVHVSLEVSEEPPALACVEVRDTGSGPPAEIADRLFEPFVTGKREGVGLGLALAAQTAEAHGGKLAWRREEDQTCFRIELPLWNEEEHRENDPDRR